MDAEETLLTAENLAPNTKIVEDQASWQEIVEFLGGSKAKAQLLPEWQSACCGSICVPGGNRVGQCSGSPACNTSIVTRQKLWVGLPPRSPVPRVATQLVSIILLPFGATDLRVAELPTTSAADGGE